jgi:lipid II:glycine glycyltransferase (peptidoglycan interpeptide bridge formation enzyme)
MKQNGICSYDLGGINPALNPGGYKFKLGLAGKLGKDTSFVGQYVCGPNRLLTALAKALALIHQYKRKDFARPHIDQKARGS